MKGPPDGVFKMGPPKRADLEPERVQTQQVIRTPTLSLLAASGLTWVPFQFRNRMVKHIPKFASSYLERVRGVPTVLFDLPKNDIYTNVK